MRTKFNLLLALIALAVILPLGAHAYTLSSDSKYDVMSVTLSVPESRREAMKAYLEQMYGSGFSTELVTQPVGGGSPYETFIYPYGGSLTGPADDKTRDTREELRKIMNGETVTSDNPQLTDVICHSLTSWYFWGGKELDGCGYHGDTVPYPDLSSVGFDNIASSWFRSKTSGNVELYDKTGFSEFLTTIYDDTAVFPWWYNDKPSSVIFSI